MKIIILTSILAAAFTGCAHPVASRFTPPSATAAVRSVNDARDQVRSLVARVPEPLKPEVEHVAQSLDQAELQLASYASNVATQTLLLNVAEDQKNAALAQADAWHDKQRRALRELWTWRLIALGAVLCVVGRFVLRYSKFALA